MTGLLVLLLLTSLAYSQEEVIGIWTLKTENGCIESYDFKLNGILESKSKHEIVLRNYSLKKVKENIFEATLVTKYGNGLESCVGKTEEYHYERKMVVFFTFNEDFSLFYVSPDIQQSDTLGPLIRQSEVKKDDHEG